MKVCQLELPSAFPSENPDLQETKADVVTVNPVVFLTLRRLY